MVAYYIITAMKYEVDSSNLTSQTLAAVLSQIYQQYDNKKMIAVLAAVANYLAAQHNTNLSIPELNNALIIISLDEEQNIKVSIDDDKCIHCSQPLSLTQRAEQLAGLMLPDDYWRIFLHMYFANQPIPEAFEKAAAEKRKLLRQQKPDLLTAEKDIWLWDENSAQAMIVLHKDTKNKLRRKFDGLKLIINNLLMLPKVWLTYKKILKQAYQNSVSLQNKIAVAIHPAYWTNEVGLLQELGNIPVLIRFYCHETTSQWQTAIELIHQLKQQNILVVVALVQNRDVVINQAQWQAFLDYIIPAIHDCVEWLEVGHATNRVKWGVWTSAEYVQLLTAIYKYKKQYPDLKLIGPAVIDFEWYRIIDILKALPKHLKLQALSQHLYVDRRGAPENFQDNFSTLEKCALGTAIARNSSTCSNKYIISEFNWPLKDTGIYSPIGSPYMAPEWFRDMPGVTEEQYAHYLIRFLSIALCSGFVEQAVIWRLSAHGYGLVDDLNQFHKRPAFAALRTYLQFVGQSRFEEKLPSNKDCYLLKFCLEHESIILAWTTSETEQITLPWEAERIYDLYGTPLLQKTSRVTVSPSPIYCFKEHT